MKAKPKRLVLGQGYLDCEIAEATHVQLNFPGPVRSIHIPVIQSGTRAGTNCWSWNGDVDRPTLKPSFSTQGVDRKTGQPYTCHTWVTDGKATFLVPDTTHNLAGQTVDMLDVDPMLDF